MGCKQTREAGYTEPEGSPSDTGGRPSPAVCRSGPARLARPEDDVITWVADCGAGRLGAAGIDGRVYVYDSGTRQLLSSFKAHRKAVNRLRPLTETALLTASNDATVRLWQLGDDGSPSADDAGPVQAFEGHRMSVSALEVLGWPAHGGLPETLFTGSRDCTVRLWDIETGKELHENKILRNVVTAVRTLPGNATVVAQASEDLQLRLWDARAGLSPAHAVRAGPNQLICMDVTPDGRFVVCGSKGFSRENCEVKVFDVRGGLRELSKSPCADQSIEALRVVMPHRCLIASKDGFIRTVSLPEVQVVQERGPAAAAYTAMGLTHLQSGGWAALAALTGPTGPALELLAFPDDSAEQPPTVWAVTDSEE